MVLHTTQKTALSKGGVASKKFKSTNKMKQETVIANVSFLYYISNKNSLCMCTPKKKKLVLLLKVYR